MNEGLVVILPKKKRLLKVLQKPKVIMVKLKN